MWIKKINFRFIFLFNVLLSPFSIFAGPIVADHTVPSAFRSIPLSVIQNAKSNLHIAYGHTSHGQQLIEGTEKLDAFMTSKGWPANTYSVEFTGTTNTDKLDFFDRPWQNWTEYGRDLGSGEYNGTLIDQDYTAWVYTTRKYLGWITGTGDTNHLSDYATGTPAYDPSRCNGCNVVIWTWCGQASYNGPGGPTHVTDAIKKYLTNMSQLELDYPLVKFVYMTGHADGYPNYSALRVNNDTIKLFCNLNNKILYDFEDIESWDPDGNYYGDKHVTAGCNWDANMSGTTEETREDTTGWVPPTPLNGDRNWALEWQDSHPGEWYACDINNYHTQHLNDNLKTYAFWWLIARIAGWNSTAVDYHKKENQSSFYLHQNYPNPFNPSTTIKYEVSKTSLVTLKIFDILGREIASLLNEEKHAGMYEIKWDASCLPGGVYFYRLKAGQFIETKKLVLLR